MFKKTEESEWTRFSRALQSQPAQREEEIAEQDEDDPLELSTVAEAPPAPDVRDDDALLAPSYQRPEPTAVEPAAYEPRQEPFTAPPMTFTPEPAPATGSELGDPGETVLGEGASFEGTIRSDRAVRVRGFLSGELESGDRVTVDGTARVEARIVARQVTVIGEVNGQIDCAGRVEIEPTGRVTGEVRTGTLVIREGAFFQGQLTMVPKDAPATDEVPEPDDVLDAEPVR